MSNPAFQESCCCGGAMTAHDDGRWDFCHPSGEHTRGRADSLAHAIEAARVEYVRFVMKAWQKGGHGGGGWCSPLD